jgi:hypothetical protein
MDAFDITRESSFGEPNESNFESTDDPVPLMAGTLDPYLPLSPFGPGLYRYKIETKTATTANLRDAAQLLSAKTMRTEVSFKDADISYKQFETVIDTHFNSEQLNVLEQVELQGNNLGIKGCRLLGDRFTNCSTHFQHLQLDNTNLGDLGCSVLFEALSISGSASTLHHLSLGINYHSLILNMH